MYFDHLKELNSENTYLDCLSKDVTILYCQLNIWINNLSRYFQHCLPKYVTDNRVQLHVWTKVGVPIGMVSANELFIQLLWCS